MLNISHKRNYLGAYGYYQILLAEIFLAGTQVPKKNVSPGQPVKPWYSELWHNCETTWSIPLMGITLRYLKAWDYGIHGRFLVQLGPNGASRAMQIGIRASWVYYYMPLNQNPKP